MADEEPFHIPQPQGYTERDLIKMIRDLEERIRRLESQVNTS
jgi:hypothetical protein